MVSLNEKRSKVRYMVQNKTEWVDDGNKFGQKMLEKMGWKSGVGLGKNEDGRTEHVDIKFKANLKGVGYVNGKYDSTWIHHSQSFDMVLQQLQQAHSSSPSTSSLNNLNDSVQQTNTRFTYKKQSSGKDLSSRTNDELDCIFGWNKANQLKNAEIAEESIEETKNETISDNLYKVSTQSIDDYFKGKSKKRAQRLYEQSTSLDDNEHKSAHKSASRSPPSSLNNANAELMNQETESACNTMEKKKRDASFIDEHTSTKSESIPDFQCPYEGSNLSDLQGYDGWKIDSTLESIIKKKHKKRK